MGEDIQGPWLDRRTGRTVMVRDMIMDGDTMCVISEIGQIDPEEFQQYYIKVGDDVAGGGNVLPEANAGSIMSMINQGLDKDEQIKIAPPRQQPIQQQSHKQVKPIQHISTASVEVKNEPCNDYVTTLIKKVIDKHPIHEMLAVVLAEDKLPINEFNMLINTFDVSISDICSYIVSNIDKERIMEPIKQTIERLISSDENK